MSSKIIFTLIISAFCAQIALVNSKPVDTASIQLEQLDLNNETINFRIFSKLFAAFESRATDDEILDCLINLSPDTAIFIDEVEESFWGCINTAGEFVQDAIQKVMDTRVAMKEQLEIVKGLIFKCKEDNSGDSTAALQCLLDETLIIQDKMNALTENIAVFIQSARDAVAEGRVCMEDFIESFAEKTEALTEKVKVCYD